MQSQKIRIVHMIASLEMGGSQSMIMNIYRNIDREKIQFDFIIDHVEHDDYREEIESLGGKIFSLPTFAGGNIFKVKKAWNDFFTEHPEYKILHTHSRSYASVYLPIAKKHGLITIAHSHSTSNGAGLTAHIKDAMQLPIRFQADYMFACSEEAGSWLFGKRAVKAKNFEIIPNAIDAKKFKFNPEIRNKLRAELDLDESFVIGHVGRLMKAKNHIFLLRCFHEFRRMNSNAKLLLVGDGNMKAEIEQYSRELGLIEHVRFIGNTKTPQDYYQAMDCFVFPSLWEGFGMGVIEAQAAGLPCLVSDVVPRSTDIGANLVSYVSLNESPQMWAKRIRGIERTDMSEKVTEAGFDISNSARKLQAFYEKLQTEGA